MGVGGRIDGLMKILAVLISSDMGIGCFARLTEWRSEYYVNSVYEMVVCET
jgi:hypothetical protein